MRPTKVNSKQAHQSPFLLLPLSACRLPVQNFPFNRHCHLGQHRNCLLILDNDDDDEDYDDDDDDDLAKGAAGVGHVI